MGSLPSSVPTTPQLGVVGKSAEGALNPDVCVTNKEVKHYLTQY